MPKQFFLILFILTVTFTAHAQNSNVTYNSSIRTNPTPEPPKTVVTGRVIYEDTGKPLRRGSIGLLKLPSRSSSEKENVYESFEEAYYAKAITDDNGEFKMESVLAGEYYPKIDVAGVLNPNNYNDFYRENEKISVEKLNLFFEKIVVIGGTKEQQVLIRVKRGGAVSGRAMYADGDPVIGARVEILRKGNYVFQNKNPSETNAQIQTDDRGFYRLAELPPGEYLIRIIEPTVCSENLYYNTQNSELKTYYGDVTNALQAKTVEIGLGEEKSELNITIPERKILTVSGVVVGKSNKKPIKNARINYVKSDDEGLLEYSLNNSFSRNIVTDEQGRWKVSDLPRGTYVFSVSPEYSISDEQSNQTKKIAPKLAGTKKEVQLADENLENVVIELPLEAKISGTVAFEDKREIKDILLYAYEEDKEISSSTSYNEQTYEDQRKSKPTLWNFVLQNVSEGDYFIQLSTFGGQEDFYIKSIKADNADLFDAPLAVTEGTEIKNVQIILSADVGILKGKINSNTKNLQSLRALVVSVEKPSARVLLRGTVVNEKGEFEIKNAPGEYFLIVQPYRYLIENVKLKHSNWVEKMTKDAEKVVIKGGQTQTITINKDF